ncbi:MAG TPA: hypothetical protein VFJ58_14965 [Armatimonadota bacterium]|nr:hypothetical protein [Armatimonadota bacterium]
MKPIMRLAPMLLFILFFGGVVLAARPARVDAIDSGNSNGATEKMSYRDNGVIRVGIDLTIGGTITYVSAHDGPNLINAHDKGREIQQSYYSGPQPYGQANSGWKNWPWNPIGAGDVYGHPARVVRHTNDGKTLYCATIPMQWALDNVPGRCLFETWITLDGRTAHVHYRLTNHRADLTQYPAYNQELPAVYTVGTLYRLFTYDGATPFKGAPLRQVQNAGPPWASMTATENWAALVNDHGFGLGVIEPGVYQFIGGFHGPPDVGGPQDDSTGYIAPVRQEILDHNIVYDFNFTLAVGTLDQIRAAATQFRVRDPRPDYRFERDRQHWHYINAHDSGFPIKGHLHVIMDQNDPEFIGPGGWWDAKDVPRLYLRAAFHTAETGAELFWSTAGHDQFSEDRSIHFTIKPDGKTRTYVLNLAASPQYTGNITGLRLDPVPAGRPGDFADVYSLGYRRVGASNHAPGITPEDQ